MYPDNKVHEANMGPTWVLSAPAGPYVDPMNFATSVVKVTVPINTMIIVIIAIVVITSSEISNLLPLSPYLEPSALPWHIFETNRVNPNRMLTFPNPRKLRNLNPRDVLGKLNF